MSSDFTGLRLLTPPDIEPLDVDAAKEYLRIDHSDDDTLLGTMIAAARGAVEDFTRRALITQTWIQTVPCIPADGVELKRPRLQSVSGITYKLAGVDTALTITTGHADVYEEPAHYFLPSAALPSAADNRPDAYAITYVCGYGDAASDVPEQIIQAIKLTLAQLYERRSEFDGKTVRLTEAAHWLLKPHQVPLPLI